MPKQVTIPGDRFNDADCFVGERLYRASACDVRAVRLVYSVPERDVRREGPPMKARFLVLLVNTAFEQCFTVPVGEYFHAEALIDGEWRELFGLGEGDDSPADDWPVDTDAN